ncbi:MAG: hypothetical protein KIH64_007665 [Mycobacterium sp.]|nr:hypothetical protein [Mycobacterium sp.]
MRARWREFSKFLCGFLAGAGVVHANMGFAIATGLFNEPHFLGRAWSATSLWLGAAVYLVVSVVFGYLGWRSAGNSAHGQTGSPQQPVMR